MANAGLDRSANNTQDKYNIHPEAHKYKGLFPGDYYISLKLVVYISFSSDTFDRARRLLLNRFET